MIEGAPHEETQVASFIDQFSDEPDAGPPDDGKPAVVDNKTPKKATLEEKWNGEKRPKSGRDNGKSPFLT